MRNVKSRDLSIRRQPTTGTPDEDDDDVREKRCRNIFRGEQTVETRSKHNLQNEMLCKIQRVKCKSLYTTVRYVIIRYNVWCNATIWEYIFWIFLCFWLEFILRYTYTRQSQTHTYTHIYKHTHFAPLTFLHSIISALTPFLMSMSSWFSFSFPDFFSSFIEIDGYSFSPSLSLSFTAFLTFKLPKAETNGLSHQPPSYFYFEQVQYVRANNE